MYDIELVEKRPYDGEYLEINFGKTNELLWVLFTDNDFNQWIGKFQKGNTFGKQIEKIDNTLAIILANGYLYIVDVKNRLIKTQFQDENIYGYVVDSENKMVITNDCMSISVYNLMGGLIHSTKRFSLDGITFGENENNIIKGKYNDCSDDWGDFAYNYLTNGLDCK